MVGLSVSVVDHLRGPRRATPRWLPRLGFAAAQQEF